MTRRKLTTWLGTVLIATAAVACSDRTEDKASDAAKDAREAAEKAADAARDAGRDAARAAEQAGQATATAGKEAASAAGASVQTAEVKMALTTDKRVDASGIDVDTDHDTKTVTLKGHVPTAAQKTIAGQIASEKAAGYRVRNELDVRK